MKRRKMKHTTEDAEVPKDADESGREEDDELVEYGLDKYDEDIGEDDDFTPCMCSLLCTNCRLFLSLFP